MDSKFTSEKLLNEYSTYDHTDIITINQYLLPNSLGFSTQISYNNNMSAHNHSFYEIFYVLSGTLEHTINGVKSNITVGDCFILPPNAVHKFKCTQQSTQRDIVVSDTLFEPILSLFADSEQLSPSSILLSHVTFDINEIAKLENLFREYSFESDFAKKRCISVEILMNIFKKTFDNNNKNSKPNNMPYIVQEIYDSMSKETFIKLGTKELYKSLKYNKSYIAHTFKNYTGITISEYVTQVRLNHIVYYLKTSDMSLQQIAEMVGIDVPYMNKIFKKKYEVTPAKYRKNKL